MQDESAENVENTSFTNISLNFEAISFKYAKTHNQRVFNLKNGNTMVSW